MAHEAKMISERICAALAAAKARGVKPGCPNGAGALLGQRATAKGGARLKAKAKRHAARVRPVIDPIRDEGITGLKAIADELNRREILTPNGGRWHATSVKNALARTG
jgi:DNA invertase Pin-like site-specific DNA recombinase